MRYAMSLDIYLFLFRYHFDITVHRKYYKQYFDIFYLLTDKIIKFDIKYLKISTTQKLYINRKKSDHLPHPKYQ